MILGDPPGIEFRDACKKCGNCAGFKWTYGENDGHSTGFSTCLSCGGTSK